MINTELVLPSAADLGRFVELLVTLPWPHSDAEQDVFFRSLGCDEVRLDPDDVNDVAVVGLMQVAALSLSEVRWTAFRHELIGVDTYLYDSPFLAKEASRHSFGLLRDHLRLRFGAADAEEPDTETSSACSWEIGGFSVELYFKYQLKRSGVQLAVVSVERNGVYGEALRRRAEPPVI